MKIETFRSPTFKRSFRNLPRNIQVEVVKREKIFRENPFDPRLKTHKLKGKLSEYHSLSISHSYRIVVRFLTKTKVLFVDCGNHSVYK